MTWPGTLEREASCPHRRTLNAAKAAQAHLHSTSARAYSRCLAQSKHWLCLSDSRACATTTARGVYDTHVYRLAGMVCAGTRTKCACIGSALLRRLSAAIMHVDQDNTICKVIQSNTISLFFAMRSHDCLLFNTKPYKQPRQ